MAIFENSKILKNEIIANIDCDIMCLTETKLLNENTIDLSEYDYSFVGHNRRELHRRAPAGSGGVGLLVKEDLLKEF